MLALYLLGQDQRARHKRFYRSAIANGVQPVSASDLATKPCVAISIRAAAGLPLPALHWGIRMSAQPASGPMWPRVSLTATPGARLVRHLPFCPDVRAGLPRFTVDLTPILPQRTPSQVGPIFRWSSHIRFPRNVLILPVTLAQYQGNAAPDARAMRLRLACGLLAVHWQSHVSYSPPAESRFSVNAEDIRATVSGSRLLAGSDGRKDGRWATTEG
jgi:hypothetical protein